MEAVRKDMGREIRYRWEINEGRRCNEESTLGNDRTYGYKDSDGLSASTEV